jgi:hypothetical protein
MSTLRNKRGLLLCGCFLLVMTFTGGLVFGQDGLAGPDKKTCKKSDGSTEAVQIGSTGVSGWCYYWTPSTGLNDQYASQPMASPPTTTTYTLTVVGSDFSFSQTDQVVVTVGGLNSFTITPKRCCYKANDKLTAEMFTITTDPPGFESMVKFSPENVPTGGASATYQSNVIAKASCGPAGVELIHALTLSVINEDIQAQVGVGIPNLPDFNWAAAEKKVDDAIKTFEDVMAGLPAPNPCPFELTHALEASYAESYLCCPEATPCQKDKFKITISYKPCFGTTCDFPFYGIPYIASINVRLGGGVCLNVSGDYSTRCDDGQVCIGASGELTLVGGISATILGGSVASAFLGIQVQGTTPSLQLCFPANTTIVQGAWCAQLDVVGEITYLTFYKEAVSRSLYPKTCL